MKVKFAKKLGGLKFTISPNEKFGIEKYRKAQILGVSQETPTKNEIFWYATET